MAKAESGVFPSHTGPLGVTGMCDRLLGAAFQYSVINLGCSGFLLLFMLLGTSSWKRVVNWNWVKFFGYISYGLYLIHLLIFSIYNEICAKVDPALLPTSGHFGVVVLRSIVAGGFAVAVSYVSRKFFEEKFLKLKHRLESKSAQELIEVAA
jgi:peptidoglycan/LPS O-acetylase OafA/YrhL